MIGTKLVQIGIWLSSAHTRQATAILMERFYRHLQGGMGKAAALRQAQLDMLKDYADPYYWSGFVLSGMGETTENKEKTLGSFTPQTSYDLYIRKRPTQNDAQFYGLIDEVGYL